MTTQTIAINTMVRREEALRMPGELDIVKHQHEVLSKKQDPWQHSIDEVVTMDRNQQHRHTLASSPLLCPSSASSESLVTALSSFPSTPGGVSFDRIVDTSIASTFEQQPASSNGSTIGSDDTLTPGCSSLQNSQMASSSSRSSTNSSEYRHSQDDKADPRYPLESQAVPRPTSVGRESLHPPSNSTMTTNRATCQTRRLQVIQKHLKPFSHVSICRDREPSAVQVAAIRVQDCAL